MTPHHDNRQIVKRIMVGSFFVINVGLVLDMAECMESERIIAPRYGVSNYFSKDQYQGGSGILEKHKT